MNAIFDIGQFDPAILDTGILDEEVELRRSRRKRRVLLEMARQKEIMREDDEIIGIVTALMEATNGVLV